MHKIYNKCLGYGAMCCHFSNIWLFATLWAVAYQTPLSMRFSKQEYWSGLPCPPPEDLLNSEIEPRSPALHVDSLPPEPPGKLRREQNCQLRAVGRCIVSRFLSEISAWLLWYCSFSFNSLSLVMQTVTFEMCTPPWQAVFFFIVQESTKEGWIKQQTFISHCSGI